MSSLNLKSSSCELKDDENDDLYNNSEEKYFDEGEDLSDTENSSQFGWADADGGRRVRIPGPGVYHGEPPYAAPIAGFHAKAESVFDALSYFKANSIYSERPTGFIPVIGLMGDDIEKNKDPAWKLYGRLRTDISEKLKAEQSDIYSAESRPVLIASVMRAENMTLLSIARPHQMFAPCLWLATMPTTIIKVPLPTVDEIEVRSLSLADKAMSEIIRTKDNFQDKKSKIQMSLGF